MELENIIEAIKASKAPRGMATKIIAVDGPGGAGKSTLATKISKALNNAPVIHTDDFASWEDPLNWWPRLIKQEGIGNGDGSLLPKILGDIGY